MSRTPKNKLQFSVGSLVEAQSRYCVTSKCLFQITSACRPNPESPQTQAYNPMPSIKAGLIGAYSYKTRQG